MRAQALEHCRECIEIAQQVGSTVISLWLADGTNYPGQDDLRGRHARLVGGLEEIYAPLPPGMRLLVEYKFFEPAFYSTDLPDWGTAALLCRRLGPQAQVLVDTGHHPQGTNVEQIVALLLAEGLLGGFHFNNRKYADDDLIVGSIDPFELFRIMREIAAAGRRERRVHDRPVAQRRGEDRRDDPVGDEHPDRVREGAARRRASGSPRRSAKATCSAAHRVLLEAFETDVRPLLARLRAASSASPTIRSRRSARAATPSALARERGTASVESAYEQRDARASGADRALRHLHRRHAVPGGRARDGAGAGAARPRGRLPGASRPAAGRCT